MSGMWCAVVCVCMREVCGGVWCVCVCVRECMCESATNHDQNVCLQLCPHIFRDCPCPQGGRDQTGVEEREKRRGGWRGWEGGKRERGEEGRRERNLTQVELLMVSYLCVVSSKLNRTSAN